MASSLNELKKELRAAIQRRYRRKYDVWTGYAPKGGFFFTLDGTPNCLHLIWMEGDPEIQSYTIPSEKQIGQGAEESVGTIPDAICMLRSGEIEWREVKTAEAAADLRKNHSDQITAQIEAAARYGVRWRLITTADLNKHNVLIRNWRQAISYLWAAKDYNLEPFQYEVALIVGDERSTTVAQVLAAYAPENQPLLIAAIFKMIQKGELSSDLSKHAFGGATIIQRRHTL